MNRVGRITYPVPDRCIYCRASMQRHEDQPPCCERCEPKRKKELKEIESHITRTRAQLAAKNAPVEITMPSPEDDTCKPA